MKLYYFDLYARGEPIRMMLTLAKVPFEDCRLTGQSWMDLKPTLEYGQMPVLELDDGTQLSQSAAIYDYIATIHGFQPESPMDKYRGQNLYEAMVIDVMYKSVVKFVFLSKPEEKEANGEIAAADYTKAVGHFAKVLSQREDKFICGNKLTLHDFTVGGIFLNLVVNPNHKDTEFWDKQWAATPDRVKKYVADLQEEMKDYLEARKECKSTM